MQTWLTDNLFQLVVLIGGGLMAFSRLNTKHESLASELHDHLNSASPHPACPAHNQAILQFAESLSEIKNRLVSIEEFLRNGRHN